MDLNLSEKFGFEAVIFYTVLQNFSKKMLIIYYIAIVNFFF